MKLRGGQLDDAKTHWLFVSSVHHQSRTAAAKQHGDVTDKDPELGSTPPEEIEVIIIGNMK